MSEKVELRQTIGEDTLILTTYHQYHLNEVKRGGAIPSVTSISGLLDKSTPLIHWATKLGYDKALEAIGDKTDWHIDEILPILELARTAHKAKKDEAANIGKKVHDYAELYAKAQIEGLVIPPVESDDQNVLRGITAFATLMKTLKPKFMQAERLVLARNDEGKPIYAGKLDVIAEVDGKVTLIDYKTGSKIYPEAVLQCAGYLMAYAEEKENPLIEQVIICHFNKETGELTTQTYQRDELKDSEDTFMMLCYVRHTIKKIEDLLETKETE